MKIVLGCKKTSKQCRRKIIVEQWQPAIDNSREVQRGILVTIVPLESLTTREVVTHKKFRENPLMTETKNHNKRVFEFSI